MSDWPHDYARAIAIPHEWTNGLDVNADVEKADTIHVLGMKNGETLALCFVGLSTGDGITVLSWDNGARLVRLGPSNGYSIEERFEGAPPAPENLDGIDAYWRAILEPLSQVREAMKMIGGDDAGA